jgi:hypothetical protein
MALLRTWGARITDYYTDSNALVKRHMPKIGSEWFQALVGQVAWNTIATTRVSSACSTCSLDADPARLATVLERLEYPLVYVSAHTHQGF